MDNSPGQQSREPLWARTQREEEGAGFSGSRQIGLLVF